MPSQVWNAAMSHDPVKNRGHLELGDVLPTSDSLNKKARSANGPSYDCLGCKRPKEGNRPSSCGQNSRSALEENAGSKQPCSSDCVPNRKHHRNQRRANVLSMPYARQNQGKERESSTTKAEGICTPDGLQQCGSPSQRPSLLSKACSTAQ